MRKAVVIGIAVMLIGITLVVFAATKLDLFSSPGGGQIGTWSGPVTVLAVEGEWAKVRMVGWVPKSQVAPSAPSGIRVAGSPGGGIWISDVAVGKYLQKYAKISGWVTNASGQEFERLFIEVIFIDSTGSVIDSTLLSIRYFTDGATLGFSEDTIVDYDRVTKVTFQMR